MNQTAAFSKVCTAASVVAYVLKYLKHDDALSELVLPLPRPLLEVPSHREELKEKVYLRARCRKSGSLIGSDYDPDSIVIDVISKGGKTLFSYDRSALTSGQQRHYDRFCFLMSYIEDTFRTS